jgi:hypothetical protein
MGKSIVSGRFLDCTFPKLTSMRFSPFSAINIECSIRTPTGSSGLSGAAIIIYRDSFYSKLIF